jgi:hypothetical protein
VGTAAPRAPLGRLPQGAKPGVQAVGRRMHALGLADLGAYRGWLESHAAEWPELDALLGIPISRFYATAASSIHRRVPPTLARARAGVARPLDCWARMRLRRNPTPGDPVGRAAIAFPGWRCGSIATDAEDCSGPSGATGEQPQVAAGPVTRRSGRDGVCMRRVPARQWCAKFARGIPEGRSASCSAATSSRPTTRPPSARDHDPRRQPHAPGARSCSAFTRRCRGSPALRLAGRRAICGGRA